MCTIQPMQDDAKITFADHMGRFYAKQYSFPPVVGRVLGYLLVCEPMEQSIGDLSDALLTSRSAIAGAINMLDVIHAIERTRPAGSRVDLIKIAAKGIEKSFDPAEYREQARLGREGLALLQGAKPERRKALEEIVSLNEFLTERLPQLLDEWYAYKDKYIEKGR